MAKNKIMTEHDIRELVGPRIHVERGNSKGEWVVAGVACWTTEDVRRAMEEGNTH